MWLTWAIGTFTILVAVTKIIKIDGGRDGLQNPAVTLTERSRLLARQGLAFDVTS